MAIIKNILAIFLLCLSGYSTYAQTINMVIDSSDISIKEKITFIKDYFQQEQDAKKFWHPKYANSEKYNFSTLIDGITQFHTPKAMLDRFKVEITELQELNDSLSYFKFALSSDKDPHIIEYKHYLVKIGNQYYIDNCKDYEKHRFSHIKTPNISFYISPWFGFKEDDLNKASEKMDSLFQVLKPQKSMPHVENFLCASIEEMNCLTNMTHFYGYVGGFTHIEQNFIVAHNNAPLYLHEFIHVLLGAAAGNSFILGEGLASYLGGLSHHHSYQDGLDYLKQCFEEGRCTFDLLWERKIHNQRDNIPTYGFAAAFCDFIITNYGYDYLLDLYNDPAISDQNLIEKVCQDQKLTKEDIVAAVKKIIEN